MWRNLKFIHMWSDFKFLHMTGVEKSEISFIICTLFGILRFTLFCRKIGLSRFTRYCVEKILAKNSIKVMFLWWWFLCVVFWLVQSEVFWLIQVMMMPMCGILTDTKRFDCYKWCFRMTMLILYTGTYASVLTDTKRAMFLWLVSLPTLALAHLASASTLQSVLL